MPPVYHFEIKDERGHKEVLADKSYLDAALRFEAGSHARHRLFKQQSEWHGRRRVFRCSCGETIAVSKIR